MGNNPSDNKNEPHDRIGTQSNYILSLTDDPSPSSDTPLPPLTPMPITPLTPFTPMKRLPLLKFPSITASNRIALTDRMVSDRVSELATNFWKKSIGPLPLKRRLDIAKAIWMGMLSDRAIQNMAATRFNSDDDLETTALKVLDMIGFIVRSVYTLNAGLPRLLQQLGHLHTKMGVTFEHYRIMLCHVNRVFKQYFPEQYTETVEYVMGEIFAYSVQLMTGQDIKISAPLDDLSFLSSLRECIKHAIGREYIFKYLHHAYCDETVVFLHLLSEFKSTTNAAKRCSIAKHIAEICISADGCFAVNLSWDSRQQMLRAIDALDESDPDLEMDFFVDIEDQLCRLIMQSHWKKFQTHMNEIYLFD